MTNRKVQKATMENVVTAVYKMAMPKSARSTIGKLWQRYRGDFPLEPMKTALNILTV